MNESRWIGWALAALVFLFAGPAWASSLGVSPSGFILQELAPGTHYDIYKESKVRLTINNGDDTSHTYTIKAYRPSLRGHWEKGFLEIPDPQWCSFDRGEVLVGPNSKGYAHLFVTIPEGEKYYNQRWAVTFGIEGKPGPGGGIALAIDVRAQIETKSKAEVRQRPDGPLGFAPSLVRFENVSTSGSQQRTVALYNNEPTTRTYRIVPLLADPAIQPRLYLTQSYQPLPQHPWLALEPSQLTVGPGSTAALRLTLAIPPAATADAVRRWEEILLVQPDQGLPGLIRVQMVPGSQ